MSTNNRLKNKVALITGASRGIGRSIALAFANEGAVVCITYLSQKDKAENLCKQIQDFGGRCYFFKMDATKREDVKIVLKDIFEKCGKLDILVNNAGFLEQKPFFEITDDDWDYTISTNLKSVFINTQIISNHFISQKSGCIINISSVGAQLGGDKASHYTASKGGINSFTKSTARILAPFGIRVNAIAPGFIRTDMYTQMIKKQSEKEIISKILLGRPGEPDEVASVAVFLASSDSSYITGHVLNVNGGFYM